MTDGEGLHFFICAVLLLALALPAGAQLRSDSEEYRFRADTTMVLVPVTVTDAMGGTIGGLDKESFTILDNRRLQRIVAFYSTDSPVSIGIVLDVSGSMKGRLELAKTSLHALMQMSNPEDDFFLVAVSSDPRDAMGPVDDSLKIEEGVRLEKAGGATALYDTVYLALHHPRLGRTTRRVLLVISDGMDNHSRYSAHEVLEEVEESDTQVYAMTMQDTPINIKGAAVLAELQRGRGFMEDLAERSGGLSVLLPRQGDPSAAVRRISSAMRNQYVIAYQSPDTSRSEKWHKIQVKVNLRRVNVHARSGYRLQ